MNVRQRLFTVAFSAFVGGLSLDLGVHEYVAHNYNWIASMMIVGVSIAGVLITIFRPAEPEKK
jgi:hypothetical protein